MSKLSPFVTKYLGGSCDALAIALAEYANLPIRAIYPVHVRLDGNKLIDPDFLHAYAVVDGVAWDAKGRRSEYDVAADFSSLLQSLIKAEDIRMEFKTDEFSNADEFIEMSGCNPDLVRAAKALEEAILPLQIEPAVAEITIRQFKRRSAAQEELEESPAFRRRSRFSP